MFLFFQPVGKFFNHRVGKHIFGDALYFRLCGGGIERAVKVKDKIFSLADVLYPLILHLFECVLDGLSLGVEYRPLERHIDMGLH